MIQENLRTNSEPLIYINNPVESKIPKAYLSLEEFKNILTDRVMTQRKKLTTKQNMKLLKKYSNRNVNFKRTTKTLDNKVKYIKVIDKSNFYITKDNKVTKEKLVKEIEPVSDTINARSIITELNTYTINNKLKATKAINTKNVDFTEGIKITEMESVLDTIAAEPRITKLETFITKPILTISNTDAINNLKTMYKEKSTEKIVKHLFEKYSDSNKFLDKVLATSDEISVIHTATNESIVRVEGYTHSTEQQLAKTTIENVTNDGLVTAEKNITNQVTDKNIQQFNEEINNKSKVITTDLETSREKTNTVQMTSAKETPRRKTTLKQSEVLQHSKKTLKKVKRSTLGRPLVFMGKQ
ncbi:uncharacterized protein LOC126776830 isoform X2 [Nymphalis io]|nr:uncharacterized protein LOC126776830 isoform X2 [Nymphalis io]